MANEYIRRRHQMLTSSGALFKDCRSISECKRLSRELQKSGAVVKVDRSADPQPKPLSFKKYGVGRDAANRFIEKKSREERDRAVLQKKKERGMTLSRSEERRLAVGAK